MTDETVPKACPDCQYYRVIAIGPSCRHPDFLAENLRNTGLPGIGTSLEGTHKAGTPPAWCPLASDNTEERQ